MVYRSRHKVTTPPVSLPTYLFESPTAPLPDMPVFLSASNPDKYSISFNDFRLYAQRLASGLLRSGLQPGDRVLLFSGNTLFFPSVLMGVIMAGCIFTGVNPTYVPRELAHQLQDSGAKYMICAENSLDTALEAAKSVGMRGDQIFIFDDGVATFEGRKVEKQTADMGFVRHWTFLLDSEETGRKYAWPDLRTEEELNNVIVLNYSSGTTGLSKGVMITHKNYVADCNQRVLLDQLTPEFKAQGDGARHLCFLPFYHAMAQTEYCIISPKHRYPVYVMPKFDFLEMLQYVQKYKITSLTLVPPVIVAMTKHPAVKKFDLSSIVSVGVGAAPLGNDVIDEFQSLWPPGQVRIKQGYGMTEATCSITMRDPVDPGRGSSVGRTQPCYETKIVLDDEGKLEAKQGERGEVWVRGAAVMKGYWGKPEATKETLTADGWLKTGDIAYVDDEDNFHVVDRKKELIKVKGLQVAPAELEALLLDHADVQDAAVIGVTENGAELPRAYIVPQSQEKATPEAAEGIKKWLAERVSEAKRLEGGVHFIDAVPKNPSGKILRKVLRERAAAESEQARL